MLLVAVRPRTGQPLLEKFSPEQKTIGKDQVKACYHSNRAMKEKGYLAR